MPCVFNSLRAQVLLVAMAALTVVLMTPASAAIRVTFHNREGDTATQHRQFDRLEDVAQWVRSAYLDGPRVVIDCIVCDDDEPVRNIVLTHASSLYVYGELRHTRVDQTSPAGQALFAQMFLSDLSRAFHPFRTSRHPDYQGELNARVRADPQLMGQLVWGWLLTLQLGPFPENDHPGLYYGIYRRMAQDFVRLLGQANRALPPEQRVRLDWADNLLESFSESAGAALPARSVLALGPGPAGGGTAPGPEQEEDDDDDNDDGPADGGAASSPPALQGLGAPRRWFSTGPSRADLIARQAMWRPTVQPAAGAIAALVIVRQSSVRLHLRPAPGRFAYSAGRKTLRWLMRR